MGETVTRWKKITLVIEVPEDTDLEELLEMLRKRRALVKMDPIERLRRLFERVNKNPVRVDKIPGREEIYDRA